MSGELRARDLFKELADLQSAAVRTLWEECCLDDPILTREPRPRVDVTVVDAVLKALEVPREPEDALEEDLRSSAIAFVSRDRQAGVAVRQLHSLASALYEACEVLPDQALRLELARRIQLVVGGLMIVAASVGLGSLYAEANRDSLTGLLNRRAFDSDLAREISRATAPRPLCVVHMDLDGLKAVNDNGGHDAGDQLIRTFSSGLVAGIDDHRAYRWGGDEFAVILADTHLCAAVRLLKGLHDTLPRFSWGAACLPGDGTKPAARELNRLADSRLYDMKHATKRLGLPRA